MILAAMELFQREGYTATSWRKLVQESGAPWGSAHHYFPDGKEQLGLAAIEMAAQRVAGLFDRCFSPDQTAADGVQRLFEVSAEKLERSGYCEGCPVATVALETMSSSPALAAACRSAFVSWQIAIETGLLRCGVAESRAGDLSATLLSLFEGGLVVSRVTGSPEPLLNAAAAMRALLACGDVIAS